MARWVVAVVCCLLVGQSTLYGAQDPDRYGAGAPSRTLLQSALSTASKTPLRAEAAPVVRVSSSQDGNWLQKHPIMAGALIGFGAGFGLAFAAAENNQHSTSLSPGVSALLYGGASAGVGALIGWGVERNRNDDDPDYFRHFTGISK
jgi:hypothetical protein